MTRLYSTPEEHRAHFPKCRTSTLSYIAKRHAVTEALKNKPRLKQERRWNLFQAVKRAWEYFK